MTSSGIFLKDFYSLNHIHLNAYGELQGNSLSPIIKVGNTSSAYLSDVKTTSVLQLNRFQDKIWIIEGVSNCKIKILGCDVQWTISPLRKYPAKMLDENEPGNLFNYFDEDIEIETSAFKTVVRGSAIRVVQSKIINNSSDIPDYFQRVIPTLEEAIRNILVITIGDDTMTVKVDLVKHGTYYMGMDNAAATYVKLYKNSADTIVYEGYASEISTNNSFNSSKISQYLNNNLIVSVSDMDTDMKKIESGQYYIEFFTAEHRKETSRHLKMLMLNTTPTIDAIARHYVGYLDSARTLQISEGLQSGVISYLD